MKVHLGNEQKAFLGDFGSSSNEVSELQFKLNLGQAPV